MSVKATSSFNTSEIIAEFTALMAEKGLFSKEQIIADGALHRFHVEGDLENQKNGWYRLDAVTGSGVFATWRDADNKHIFQFSGISKLSAEEHEKLIKLQAELASKASRIKQLEQDEAAAQANFIWENAEEITEHPYLNKKNVKNYGLKKSGDSLVVPMLHCGEIRSVQFIKDDGTKRFLKHGQIDGCFYQIGEPTHITLICEGYATGASIHEATELQVIVAFNAQNLPKITPYLKENQTYIICADNDQFSKGNSGLNNARKAASNLDCDVVYPKFKDLSTKPTDFNDLHNLEGLDEVRRQIEEGNKSEIQTIDQAVGYVLETGVAKSSSVLSKKMAFALQDNLLYDEFNGKWYIYNKTHWVQTTESQIQRFELAVLDNSIKKFSRGTLTGLEYFLRVRLGVPTEPNAIESGAFNQSKHLLPFHNGVLNIETKAFKPHSSKDRFNWCFPYNYDETATCPEFHSLIEWLSSNDKHTAQVLYCFLAAIIRGRSDLQKYLEITGLPGTGKSSFLTVAQALVGPQNLASSRMDSLNEKFEAANFYGKKLLIFPDATSYSDGASVFKAVTGQDPIRYEEKYNEKIRNFVFQGMVIVTANRPIIFDDQSTAIVRRRISVHIDSMLDESRKQKNYYEKLKAEMPGVMNFLLQIPNEQIDEVLQDVNKARHKSMVRGLIETNPVAEWIDERCIYDKNVKTLIGVNKKEGSEFIDSDIKLYPNYLEWCQGVGKKNTNLKNFTRSVTEVSLMFEHKYVFDKKITGGKAMFGIRLRKPSDTLPTPLSNETIMLEHQNQNF